MYSEESKSYFHLMLYQWAHGIHGFTIPCTSAWQKKCQRNVLSKLAMDIYVGSVVGDAT